MRVRGKRNVKSKYYENKENNITTSQRFSGGI